MPDRTLPTRVLELDTERRRSRIEVWTQTGSMVLGTARLVHARPSWLAAPLFLAIAVALLLLPLFLWVFKHSARIVAGPPPFVERRTLLFGRVIRTVRTDLRKVVSVRAWQDGGERGRRVIFEAATADHELLTIHDRIYRDEADLAKAEQLCSAIADVLDAEDRGLQRQI